MHTRDELRVDTAARTNHGTHLVGGMGRATVSALWALAGCVALIVVGAAMSICWAIHPLLMVGAAIGVIGLAAWAAGHVFRAGGR